MPMCTAELNASDVIVASASTVPASGSVPVPRVSLGLRTDQLDPPNYVSDL